MRRQAEETKFLLRVHRVVHANTRARRKKSVNRSKYSGKCGFLDSSAIGRTQHYGPGPVQGAICLLGECDTIGWHPRVCLTGGSHDRGTRVVPQIKPWIHRYAVPTNCDAWLVDV